MNQSIVRFDAHVIDSVMATIGRHEPETGGIFGADLSDPYHIKRYHYCQPALKNGKKQAGPTHFSPDDKEINTVIDDIWSPKGYWLVGIVHSHPGMMNRLSIGNGKNNDGDMTYFQNILAHEESVHKGLKFLIAPIINFINSESIQITTYIIKPNQWEAEIIDCCVATEKGDHMSISEYLC